MTPEPALGFTKHCLRLRRVAVKPNKMKECLFTKNLTKARRKGQTNQRTRPSTTQTNGPYGESIADTLHSSESPRGS